MSLLEALGREDKVIIDTRSTDDIVARGNAVIGHINIPWADFAQYESRFKHMTSLIPSKDTPVILYADEEAKVTPELFKAALVQCGYTVVHSCVSAADLVALSPALQTSHHSNLVPPYADPADIRILREQGAVLIDARDPDEIERYKDSFVGHINIPWSTFPHYAAKLNQFGGELLGSNGKGKNSPVMVICMRGRRAMFFKDALEKQCGFTNVYNCQNPGRVHPALPEVEETGVPNRLSEHLTVDEIRALGKTVHMIDVREPEEIARSKNAIAGHFNIPWSSFSQYASRLTQFDDVIGARTASYLVYCVNGRRAQACKEKMQKECGFSNVFSCTSSADIIAAFPDIECTGEAKLPSQFASVSELRQLFELGAIIVDVREPEEIEITGAFAGHINIPWSSFDDYLPRLSHFEAVLGEKSRPVIVHCINGRRAALFKEALEKHCGYTKVFNGENPDRVCSSAPELKTCGESNAVSSIASAAEIKSFLSQTNQNVLIVDCREEDEIMKSADAVPGHVNIPWSSFYSQGAAYFRAIARGGTSDLNASSPIAVYCSKGWRSGHMKRFLASCGYVNVINCMNAETIFDAVPQLALNKSDVPVPFSYP